MPSARQPVGSMTDMITSRDWKNDSLLSVTHRDPFPSLLIMIIAALGVGLFAAFLDERIRPTNRTAISWKRAAWRVFLFGPNWMLVIPGPNFLTLIFVTIVVALSSRNRTDTIPLAKLAPLFAIYFVEVVLYYYWRKLTAASSVQE